MTFDGTTTLGEESLEQAAMQSARRLVGEKGTSSRKHFLDAYAEHLDALKRARTVK